MSSTERETVRFKVLQAIELEPTASQRDLAKTLGVSLGSINYCVKALVAKGLVKVENFAKSDNKKGYAYYLTPEGIIKKTEITASFLKRKLNEYESLKEEIAHLKVEMKKVSKPFYRP